MDEVSVQNVKAEAEKELLEEKKKDAKNRIKGKLRELDDAKVIVENIELELEDLYAAIASGN